VIYINGFGIGLKQRLTMSDNIYLLSSIMGLNQKEIRERFADIVAFSELEEFVDTKIYQFSYGMILRLCFSIAIHCLEYGKHDIMLLDEVFGSGADFSFEQKAIAKMENLIKKGASVIIVSHNLEIIEKYCDRAILMKDGQIIKEGSPKEVIGAYVNDKK
jgi:ABC-type polysaccharide/polyol phosphate transport system ATPase subunit